MHHHYSKLIYINIYIMLSNISNTGWKKLKYDIRKVLTTTGYYENTLSNSGIISGERNVIRRKKSSGNCQPPWFTPVGHTSTPSCTQSRTGIVLTLFIHKWPNPIFLPSISTSIYCSIVLMKVRVYLVTWCCFPFYWQVYHRIKRKI